MAPTPEVHEPAHAATSSATAASSAGVLPPTVRPRDQQWRYFLEEIYENEALTECADEGPILYALVWFIDHITMPKCPTPRTIRIGGDSSSWEALILEVWRDHFRAAVPFEIHKLSPRPPKTTWQLSMVHLLIEQNPMAPRTANVVSVSIHHGDEDRLMQSAYSMGRWMSAEDLIDLTEINPLCETRRCHAVCGIQHFQQFIRDEISSGMSIEVFSRPARLCGSDPHTASSDQPHVPRLVRATSGTSLMQQRQVRRILQGTVQGATMPQCHFVFDTGPQGPHAAQVITANAPLYHLPQPAVPQDWRTLQDVWRFYFHNTGFLPWATLTAQVWYSDHLRYPRSIEARFVRLGPDLLQWIPRLLEAWEDWYVATAPVEFLVVHPTPSGGMPEVQLHVVLLQHPLPERRTILVTPMGHLASTWEPETICLTTSPRLDHSGLLRAVDLVDQCESDDDPVRCRSWCGDVEILVDEYVDVDHAMSFLVTVDSLVDDELSNQLARTELQDEAASFLQLHFQKAIAQIHDMVLSDFTLLPLQTSLPLAPVDQLHREASALCSLTLQFSMVLQQWMISLSPPTADVQACDKGVDKQFDEIRCSSPSTAVSISLSTALPAPLPPPHEDDVVMYAQEAGWFDALHHAELSFVALPEGLQLHASTYHALQQPDQYRNPQFAHQVAMYVDGATGKGRAAWSIAFVQFDGLGVPHLLGCVAGLVSVAQTDRDWYGASSLDNIAAEFQALLLAQAAGLVVDFALPVVLRPDLQLGVQIAEDHCSCSSNPVLVQQVRAIGEVFRAAGHTFCEVRAHRGEPWNELADALAGHVVQTGSPVGLAHFPILHSLASDASISWAWLREARASYKACLPPEPDPGVWHLASPVPLPRPSIEDSAAAPTSSLVNFKIATANVLALDVVDEAQQILRSSRAVRLGAQWHSSHLLAIGLQETRRPAGTSCTDHYITFASGANTIGQVPHHGCELWLHRHLPWLTQSAERVLTFAQMRATIALADPRRLVVNLQHEEVMVSFVVLHAPCKTASPGSQLADIQAWWDETVSLLRDAQLAPCTWVFADVNAPLGSADCDHFGTHGAGGVNEVSSIVEQAVIELDWRTPSTFAEIHQGPHTTWIHPRGSAHRLDYVFCSPMAHAWSVNTWTLPDHDNGFAHADHIPVLLHVRGHWVHDHSLAHIHWDPVALADPQRCADFQNALRTLPLPAWSTDVDTHASTWESNVLQLAQQFFAKRTGQRQRPRLSESTLNLIALKRSILDFCRVNHLMHDPEYKQHLREVEREVRERVDADQQLYYAQMIDELARQGDLRNYKLVYKMLVRLGGRPRHKHAGGKALPLLCDAQGNPVTTFHDQQKLWMKQFAEVEAGHLMSRSSLAALHHSGLGIPAKDFDLHALPTLYDIQQQMRKLKRGKACGPNRLPPDVLKAGGAVMAQHMLTLTTKIAVRGVEPLSWRGGKLIPLHKGRLPRSDPAGYRSIFISDYTTKIYHGALRRHLLDAWTQVLSHLQFGGRQGLAADQAHHCLQAHAAHAHARQHPMAILFLDFRAAFYSVVRQGLFHHGPSPEAFVYAMHQMGISPDEVNRLLATAADDGAVSGISSHALCLLKDLMERTYFTVEGLDMVALTTRGTRPGDPVGDAFFNVAMAVVLKRVTHSIQQQTTAVWEGAAGAVGQFDMGVAPAVFGWFEVAFVDDCAIAMRAPSNDALLSLAHIALRAIHTEAEARGLGLNWDKGKTELLLQPHGSGTRALKERLAQAQQMLDVPVGDQLLHLRVVHAYKHLGSWLQTGAKHARDARAKLTCARQAWGPLVRPVLRQRKLDHLTKVRLMESLVFTRATYNVHVWSWLDEKELDKWAHGMRSMIYPLLKAHLSGLPPFQFTTEQIFGLAGMVPPIDQLHAARLRYFQRWLSHCPQVLWSLLVDTSSHESSWLCQLRRSLRWFVRFYGARCQLNPDGDLLDWILFVSVDGSWKGRVKSALRSCRRYYEEHAKAAVWEKAFEAQLHADGVEMPCSWTSPPTPWRCELCQEHFGSRRALAMHASKMHGYRTLVKHYAMTGQCSNCARDFHSRLRLCAHLRTATVCLDRIRHSFPPMTVEEMAQLDQLDRDGSNLRQQGWLPTKALLPVVRAWGPPLPPANSAEAQLMWDRWQRRYPARDAFPAFQALIGTCEEPSRDAPGPAVDGASPEADMFFVYQSFGGHCEGADGRYAYGGLARLHALLHIRTFCFVHFFSGYRRGHDIQWCIEKHVVQGAVQIFCLSIDYCLQREQGDLTGRGSHRWWAQRIESGAILGIGGGPPCETWSAARHQPDGPPPLRSFDDLFGLPSLRMAQWDQVAVGSELMRFVADMLCWWLELAAVVSSSTRRSPRGSPRLGLAAFGPRVLFACSAALAVSRS
eukprot:s1056_g19.t1